MLYHSTQFPAEQYAAAHKAQGLSKRTRMLKKPITLDLAGWLRQLADDIDADMPIEEIRGVLVDMTGWITP